MPGSLGLSNQNVERKRRPCGCSVSSGVFGFSDFLFDFVAITRFSLACPSLGSRLEIGESAEASHTVRSGQPSNSRVKGVRVWSKPNRCHRTVIPEPDR